MSDKNASAHANTENSTYAQDIKRIQAIIEKLNKSDCDIDEMLSDVKEATALIEKCQKKLCETGIEITEVLNRLDIMNQNQDN